MRKHLFTSCYLFAFILQGFTQISIDQQVDLAYFLPQENFAYRADIPTPKQFFGFEIGEQCLNNAQVVAYLRTMPE